MRKKGRIGAGRVLISAAAVVTAVGPFVADWNGTHIHNPDWPPHAKFHNAQTMSMGVALAAVTLQQLWRKPGRERVGAAAVTASLYWLTQASALAYPGSAAVDPPAGGRFPQARVAVPSLGLVALGYVLERRRSARVQGGELSG